MIRFTKTIGGKIAFDRIESSHVIIQACFIFCEWGIQKRVAAFLLGNVEEIMFGFGGDEIVILKRERVEDESKK